MALSDATFVNSSGERFAPEKSKYTRTHTISFLDSKVILLLILFLCEDLKYYIMIHSW